jgi:DNA-binding NarL/FixJ family response regulator
MRKAIRTLLGNQPDIELVGEAQNFAETVSLTRQFKPQVVILDLHMPDSSNLTPMNVSEGLRAYEAAVLAISVWNDEDTRALARSYGATELLDKMHLGQELIPAVMKLGSGNEAALRIAQARPSGQSHPYPVARGRLGAQARPGGQARPGAQAFHE